MNAARTSTRQNAGNGSGCLTAEAAASRVNSPPSVADATIEGMIFDTADVLFDATLWPRLLVRLVHRLGIDASYPTFSDDWERNYLADVYCGRRNYDEAFQSFLLAAGLSWAQIDEVEAASRIERRNLEQNARPLPGVMATIRTLCRWGVRLVAWADSPWPTSAVVEQLRRLGLAEAFSAVLSSFDLEATQPASGCYQAALAALNLPARRAAYVGHDALHLAGANAAGLRTFAFNYQAPAQADYFLSSIEELLPLVRSMLADARSAHAPLLPMPSPSDPAP